jgi:hypothetical protein
MRIHHCRLPIVVTQQFLHRPDLIVLLERMRRSAVSNGMTTEAFGELCCTTGMAHGRLHTMLMGVMPADSPRAVA